MSMTTWQKLISVEMDYQDECWDDVIFSTLSQEDQLVKFDNGYGGEEGKPFTLWTKERVYFPVCYDGAEWVASVPRNPCNEQTVHIGGG